ncbi:MAG: FAD binding domain-containing protein [Treponema sp.]|nr:FAD binding domain-containing protein [Treponema sp.]
MAENNTIVCFARSIQEVLYQIKTVKNLQIVGGCTKLDTLPQTILSIRAINELSKIEKHERFIDFGPAVTLGQMLSIGEKHLPHILYEAIKTIGNPAVRNMATLGGNICGTGTKKTLYAPLLALGAKLDLTSEENTIHQQITQFTEIPQNYILTKISIPINDWDVSIFKKLWSSPSKMGLSASYAFLAKTERSILTNVRIAYAGPICFRSQELENSIIGSKLPLSIEKINFFTSEAEHQFDAYYNDENLDPIIKQQFLKLISYSFAQLT